MDLLHLTPVQASVYRELLRRPGTPAEGLATTLGLATEEVADALAVLTGRGLLSGLVPLRPDAVLEPGLVQVEQEIATTRAAVLTARRELGELVELYVGGVARSDKTVEVERIENGRDAVQRRIDELVASLRVELLSISPGYTLEENMAEEDEQSRELVARGVRLQTLLGPKVLETPALLRHAYVMDELGDETRIHPHPPMRLLLLDRRVAVLPIDPQASVDGALFVWSTTLVGGFLAVWDSLWKESRPVRQASTTPEGLSDRERRLLELLAAGLIDEAVARHLGVSVRTVRRESAALLERLGAGTRFQAGVEAARRGWL